MRYLIVHPGLHPESRPWVVLETADPLVAEAQPYGDDTVTLARAEALLDPDYEAAVMAWDCRDDSAAIEDLSRQRIEWDAEDAVHEAINGPAPTCLEDMDSDHIQRVWEACH